MLSLLAGVVLELGVAAQAEPRLLGDSSVVCGGKLFLLDGLFYEVVEACL